MKALWDTVWDQNDPTHGDWAPSATDGTEPDNQGGLANVDPFGTAILIALYSDARLPDSMIGAGGFTKDDQFTWHGNLFGIEPDEGPLGSMLFTLERAQLSNATGKMAVHYASEALQVLVKNHWCTGFGITYNIDKLQGKIELTIIPYGLTEAKVYFADLFPLQ